MDSNGVNTQQRGKNEVQICMVWAHNLECEIDAMSSLVEKKNNVAVDSEFPGWIVRPVASLFPRKSKKTSLYQKLRTNIDLLKVLQVGLTLFDGSGNVDTACSTWQFNFKFDLDQDMYAQDAIDNLIEQGVDFAKHKKDGIDPLDFAELLISSGLVLMDNVTWVSFHGMYDFTWMLKLLMAIDLPSTEKEYGELLELHFPRFFDMQILLNENYESNEDHSTLAQFHLNGVAKSYGIERTSNNYQTGADSILTMKLYLKLKESNSRSTDVESHCRCLYGLKLKDAVEYLSPAENDEYATGYPKPPPYERPSMAIPILPPRNG